MFHKPFRVKTQNAIKGSDRKKLRADIGSLYPSILSEELNQLVPNKEDMAFAKIHCHSGETVLVYCLKKNPIFFNVDKIIYPTVYLLWKFPDLLPKFTTWPAVFPKIQGGADLMLPGVCLRGDVITPQALGNLTKEAICAINLLGNKAPVAVGYTTMSSRDMVLDAGMKGKGVIIVHCHGDHMWAFGEKSDPPHLEDIDLQEERLLEDENNGEEEAVEGAVACEGLPSANNTSQETQEISSGMDLMEAASNKDSQDEQIQSTNSHVEDVSSELAGTHLEEGDSQEITKSPQEKMDELLQWCFLCALKRTVHKSDLPILTSNFYRNHILPCCPKEKTLDVKKSSYKKLSKFLNEMKIRGFISLKTQKDVESITEVHRDHPDLRSMDASGIDISPKAGTSEEATAEACFYPPVITEVFLVTAKCLPIFRQFGCTKGSALTPQEVRRVLTDYAKDNELQDTENRGHVKLDPHLADLVLAKGEYKESLRYDDLTMRTLSFMSPAHQVKVQRQSPMLQKGKLKPIDIKVVQRSGNKKATLVENLETYGIDPHQLAHLVQVGVACSTSVTTLPGKDQGMQVMVQGNQVAYIADLLLDKYKLQRKWIAGLEKAPKGKRR